jgi:hypothetical protein
MWAQHRFRVCLVPLTPDRSLPLRGLLGDLILQIVKDFFTGLHDLVNLLGEFVAHKYADDKNNNEQKHLNLPFLSEFYLVRLHRKI